MRAGKRESGKIITETKGDEMIETFEIEGLGRFNKKRKFLFKSGLNVIAGPVTSGKTTLVELIAALAGSEAAQRQIWSYGLLNTKCKTGKAKLKFSGGSGELIINTTKESVNMHMRVHGREDIFFIKYDDFFTNKPINPMWIIEGLDRDVRGGVFVADIYGLIPQETKVILERFSKKEGVQTIITGIHQEDNGKMQPAVGKLWQKRANIIQL